MASSLHGRARRYSGSYCHTLEQRLHGTGTGALARSQPCGTRASAGSLEPPVHPRNGGDTPRSQLLHRQATQAPRAGAPLGKRRQEHLPLSRQEAPTPHMAPPQDSGGELEANPLTGGAPGAGPSQPRQEQASLGNSKLPMIFYTMYNLQFPLPWRMPPPGELPLHCRSVDPMRAIEKGLIKPFAGTVDDYPRFYNSFYNVVHIQPGAVLYKVLALDRLITDERTTRLFSGLGMSPSDYVLRIERLEQHYGGPDRLQSYHLRILRQLKGPMDRDFGNFEKYTNALVSYLRNAAVHEAENLVLRDQLKDAMSRGLALQYNQYLWAQRMADNNRSIALFLSQRLDSEIRAKESGKSTPGDRLSHAMHEHVTGPEGEQPLTCEAVPEHAQAHAARTSSPTCSCCQQGNHRLGQCEKFFLMSPTERRSFAVRESLCFTCLEGGHRSHGCPGRRTTCSICGERHNYLLHLPSNTAHVHQEEDLINFQVADTQYLSCGFQHTNDQPAPLQLDVALTYMTVWLRNPTTKQEVRVNLLADTGANTSCIDAELATELGLTGPKEPYHVQVGGGKIHSYSSFLVTAEIQGVHATCTPHSIQLQAYKQPCGRLGRVDWATARSGWPHLRTLDLPEAANRPVQGIIGTQDFYLLAPVEPAVVGERNEPVAFQSLLGWMVGGQVHPRPQHAMHLHVMLMANVERDCCSELRRALERTWTPDTSIREAHRRRAEGPVALTALEQRAAEVFERTRRRGDDGKYEIGLLWKNHIRPPRNYSAALSAFYSLERTMDRNPEMRAQFVKTINEWLNKHVAAYLPPTSTDIRYVLPTFLVVRLDKQTTSYRLVVDGARRFNNSCINDRLMPGQKLIQNIFDILVRFRQGRFAFTCDINAMYLNVRVSPEDRPYLCLFYREHSGAPIRVIQLQSHPFGLSSSPYVAMRTVKDHLESKGKQFPRAAKVAKDSVLVDDFIVSGDDVQELYRTRGELEAALMLIGMQLHKMAASHPRILEGVHPDRVAKTKILGEEDTHDSPTPMPTVKTLGILWNASADTVAILFQPKYGSRTLSLRNIVSDGGRFYDMLGLGLPIAMTSRILQQLCWADSSAWDSPIAEELASKWLQWSENTKQVAHVSIPRAIKHRDRLPQKQRLVIFVDASAEALAAVAYVQNLYQDGQRDARLLAARGKVASLRKQESIPRLECAAAAMGAELGAKLATILHWNPEDTLYFSDSTTTLWWIRSTKPLKVFVANRVCMILDSSTIQQWKHVATKENPADIPTRTCSVQVWARSSLWWWGPKFLTLPDNEWPAQPPVVETAEGKEETRTLDSIVRKLHMQPQSTPYSPREEYLRLLWGRHSSPRRGLRRAAALLFVWEHWRSYKRSRNPYPWDQARMEARLLRVLITGDQRRHLWACIQALDHGRPLPAPFACWRVQRDSDGILRINGRLGLSRTLSATARHPILLTADMPCALELMRLRHELDGHAGGANYLLSQMRQEYWVLQGLKVAKQALKQCAHCQQRNARAAAQNTAPLHFTRENAPKGRVFHSLGIDMFGPMEVKMGRGKPRGKRYGIIFTCGFSRAINVEVMRDATADSCLMAFKRHVAIYGQPQFVNSDQGANLQYVRKVMHEKHVAWEDAQPLLQQHYPTIKWHTNPPYSPSYGGHYESLIKVLKNTFKHLAKWPRYCFDDEQLLTGLKEAAAMANMRPLTEVSTDPNDPPPLRPSGLSSHGDCRNGARLAKPHSPPKGQD